MSVMSDLVLENTIKCMVENRDRTDRFQIKKKTKKKYLKARLNCSKNYGMQMLGIRSYSAMKLE